MSVAMQAIITGMPESSDLHTVVHDGRTAVMVGSTVLATYDNDDLAMRNMVLVMLPDFRRSWARVRAGFER